MRRPGYVGCRSLVALGIIMLAVSGIAEPAKRSTSEIPAQVEESFLGFARHRMKDLAARGIQAQRNPSIRPGASAPLVTYRSYERRFRTEIQTTANAASPYVGMLHYTEDLYSCSDIEAVYCEIASSTPITEVFRLREGSWTY